MPRNLVSWLGGHELKPGLRDSQYDRFVREFSQFLQTNFVNRNVGSTRMFPYTSFPVHLSINTIEI
jgi:hypothetical protein